MGTLVHRIIVCFGLFAAVTASPLNVEHRTRPTDVRIREQGYPVETHRTETVDNYVITLYRIPYSPKLQNRKEHRPAILLQHGMTGCSDAWIALGVDNALAFMLSDAGYDVWLGNVRGNRYSRSNTRLSPNHPYFWRFSWHEIAMNDITRMIDYILATTGESAIHYTGHSQGTTVFFVLLSKLPEYHAKIKTAHLLAPVAFMSNMKTILAKYTRRLVGRPNKLTRLLDTQEIMPDSQWEQDIKDLVCDKHAIITYLCRNFWGMWSGEINGRFSSTTNATAQKIFDETHPAGASSTQVLHYMQEYESGHFREFDHGLKKNLKMYGQPDPPDYAIENVQAEAYFYYSDGDLLADPMDVEYLAEKLGRAPTLRHIPQPDFDHSDFVLSNLAKQFVNEPILQSCNVYEATHPTSNKF